MASIRPPVNPDATTNTTLRPPMAPAPAQTVPPLGTLYGPGPPGTWSGPPGTEPTGPSVPAVGAGSYTSPSSLTGTSFLSHAPTATPYGDFAAPSAANFEHSPDYQYLLDAAAKARQGAAAARGTLLNTGTVKGLQRDAAGIAAGDFQQAYNRALSAYTTNRDTNAQNFGQSTTQFRGDLDIFDANNRNRPPDAAGSSSSARSLADIPQVGSTGLSYGPTIGDYASLVAQARQANAAGTNMRPGWIDRRMGPVGYQGPSLAGGIGRRGGTF